MVTTWTGKPVVAPAAINKAPLDLPGALGVPGFAAAAAGGKIVTYFQPDHSAATAYCGATTCRLNVHIVFKVTTGGSPTDSMFGGMMYSFDGGPFLNGGSTFYEQHIDAVGVSAHSRNNDYCIEVFPPMNSLTPTVALAGGQYAVLRDAGRLRQPAPAREQGLPPEAGLLQGVGRERRHGHEG